MASSKEKLRSDKIKCITDVVDKALKGDILKLSVNCRIKYGKKLDVRVIAEEMEYKVKFPLHGAWFYKDEIEKGCEILGRPIILEDILSTLHWKSIFYYVSTSGQFKAKEDLDCIGDVVYWNLGKPLHEQNDLVVDFLTILLS